MPEYPPGVRVPAEACVPPARTSYPPKASYPATRAHAIGTAAERAALAERVARDRFACGLAATTARAYGAAVVELLSYCAGERGRGTVEAVTRGDVEAYYRWAGRRHGRRPGRETDGPLARRSLWRLLRYGREAFGLLVRAGELAADVAGGIAVEAYLPDAVAAERLVVTPGQVAALYDAAEALPPERWPRRARAVLALAYGCGLRAAELSGLRTGDVRLAERRVVVAAGKGGRRRVVPMGPGVARDLEAYLFGERRAVIAAGRAWGGAARDAVLVNDHGGAMRGYTANRILARLVEVAGLIDEVTGEPLAVRCHALRRSLATHLLARGVTTEQLRVLLGHASVDTTQVYVAVDAEALREADVTAGLEVAAGLDLSAVQSPGDV